jgi:hypothetical protein
MSELETELGNLAIACQDSSMLAGLSDTNPVTGLPTTANFSIFNSSPPMEFQNYGAVQSDAGVLPSQGGPAWGQLKPFSMFPDSAFVAAPVKTKAAAGPSGVSIFSNTFDAILKGVTPIAQAELAVSQQSALAQQNAAAVRQAALQRAAMPQPRPPQSSVPWTWIAGGIGALVVLGIVLRRKR